MKIINKAKFITRILELITIFLIVYLTPLAINYANTWRGYKAFGGEYLLPVLGLIIIMGLETMLETIKRG